MSDRRVLARFFLWMGLALIYLVSAAGAGPTLLGVGSAVGGLVCAGLAVWSIGAEYDLNL